MMIAEIENIQEQLQQKWLILWWASVIGLLTLRVAWRQGLFKPFQFSPLPFIRGIDVLKGFGFFLFIEIFLIPALMSLIFLLQGKNLSQLIHLNSEVKGWIHIFIVLGGFLGASLAFFELTLSQRRTLWHQTNTPWYEHVGIGIATWFVSFPLVLAFSQAVSLGMWHLFHYSFEEQVVVQNLREAMVNPWLFSLTGLLVITIVPLTEEFLFRGLLQSWLKHRFHNRWVAIALSSFIFALFHYSSQQGMTNIELLSSLFLLSCMLGYIYERQRSLWAPLGLHSFFNFMSLMMLSQNA